MVVEIIEISVVYKMIKPKRDSGEDSKVKFSKRRCELNHKINVLVLDVPAVPTISKTIPPTYFQAL